MEKRLAAIQANKTIAQMAADLSINDSDRSNDTSTDVYEPISSSDNNDVDRDASCVSQICNENSPFATQKTFDRISEPSPSSNHVHANLSLVDFVQQQSSSVYVIGEKESDYTMEINDQEVVTVNQVLSTVPLDVVLADTSAQHAFTSLYEQKLKIEKFKSHALKLEHTSLNTQLKSMKTRVESLQDEYESVKIQLDATKTECEAVTFENATMKTQLKAVDLENAKMKTQLKAVKLENGTMKAQLEAAKMECEAVKSKNAIMKAQYDIEKAQRDLLKMQNKLLVDHLNKLSNSN